MKTVERNTSSSSSNQLQMKRQPFFSAEGQHSFFSDLRPDVQLEPFFNHIQEARNETIQDVDSDNTLISNNPSIQAKCSQCETEEEVQAKEEEQATSLQETLDIQTKPIFESDTREQNNIQTKRLTVGSPNDKYEREADSVADQVVQRMEGAKPMVTEDELPEVQAKLNTSENQNTQENISDNVDTSRINGITSDPSISPITVSISSIQAKCESCEEEVIEQGEEQEIQRKIGAGVGASGLPTDDEDPDLQLRAMEMEMTEYPILFKKMPSLQLKGSSSSSGSRERIVEEAQKMVGKIEAKKNDGSGRRLGAEHLLEIFHLAAKDEWPDEVIENVKYTKEFPHWCGIFSVYAIKKAGIDLGYWQMGKGVSAFGTLQPTDNPQPGDIGYFTKLQHHCIIKAVNGDMIDSIDGNSGNFSEVKERTRPRSQFHAFFTAFTGSEKYIQRKEETTASSHKNSLGDKLSSKAGKGMPMAGNIKSQMESGFGADFSGVNIHTDSDAISMSKELGAQAFTHGNDIYFNEGKYNTGSTSGKHLLAHELTHTVQQGASVQGNIISRSITDTQSQWFVRDDVEPQDGQLTRSEFLRQLHLSVCRAVNESLEGTPYTSENCPYLRRVFRRYENENSERLQQIILRYAPETSRLNQASEVIQFVSRKSSRIASQWAATGNLADIPAEIRNQLPTGLGDLGFAIIAGATSIVNSIQQGVSSALGLFFKAKPNGAKTLSQTPERVMHSLGTGHSLTPNIQGKMEKAYGTNFSNVKVHTGTNAEGLNQKMNSKAFAVGNHIAFGAGQYNPGTINGDALIAHELAHVQQQSDTTHLQTSAQTSNQDNKLEKEADNSAVNVVSELYLEKDLGTKEKVSKSGLSLQRCSIDSTPPPFSAERISRGVYHELSDYDEDEEGINASHIRRLVEGLTSDELQEVEAYYAEHYSRYRDERGLMQDINYVLLNQGELDNFDEEPADLYKIYRGMNYNVFHQTGTAAVHGDYIERTPAGNDVLPEFPVNYSIHTRDSLPPVRGYRWLVENDPVAAEESLWRGDVVIGPRGRNWENATWDFPGTHKVICMVEFGFDHTTLVHFHSMTQIVRDLRGAIDDQFWEDIDQVPDNIASELLNYERLTYQLRQNAIQHGVSAEIVNVLGNANAGAIAIETLLRSGDPIPSALQTQTRSDMIRFYELLREEVAFADTTHEHSARGVTWTTTSNRYGFQNWDRSREIEVLNNSGIAWNVKIQHFISVTNQFDTYVADRLEQGGMTEAAEQLRYAGPLSGELRQLYSEHPNIKAVPAVFYQQRQAITNSGTDSNAEFDLEHISLRYYVYRENEIWHLIDLTNPKAKKDMESSGGDAINPPLELFERLNSKLKFPLGMLYFRLPSGTTYSLRTTEPWSLSDWLAAIGITLGLLAITVGTLGSGTAPAAAAATVLFVGSAAAGVGSGVADIYERSQLDELTTKAIVLDLLTIFSSAASGAAAALRGFSTIVLSSRALNTGLIARAAAGADRYYKITSAVALGADVLSLAVFTGDFMQQYNKIVESTSGSDQDVALRRLLQQAILTGGMTLLAIRGGLTDARGGRQLFLDVDARGVPFVRRLLTNEQLLANPNTTLVNTELESLLANRSLSGDVQHQIRGEISSAVQANIPRSDLETYIRRLSSAGTDEAVIHGILRELRVQRLGLEIGGIRGSNVFDLTTGYNWDGRPMDFHRHLRSVFLNNDGMIARNGLFTIIDNNQFYTLRLRDSSGAVIQDIRIDIQFGDFVNPTGNLQSMLRTPVHGAEQGPAVFRLAPPEGSDSWRGLIYLDQRLRPQDFRAVLGHELDEIADIVHTQRGQVGTISADELRQAIAGQQRASVFLPGSTSRTPTAHDRAAARQLGHIAERIEGLNAGRITLSRAEANELRRQYEQTMRSMGIWGDGVDIPYKMTLLETEGVPRNVRQQIEVDAYHQIAVRTNPDTAVTPDLVRHLLYPLPNDIRRFKNYGVSGGHFEAELKAFEAASGGEYVFRQTTQGTVTTASGRTATVKGYEQQMRDPSTGTMETSTVPNSTFDNMDTYVDFIEEFTQNTLIPHLQSTSHPGGQVFLGIGGAPALSHGGVSVGGILTYNPANASRPVTFTTVFVDANSLPPI